MKVDIQGGQAFSYLDVTLDPGETIITESDAMSSMDATLDLTASFNGGLIKGLLRKYLGGETLFISRFSNNGQKPADLKLVQPTPGEIKCVEVDQQGIYLQPGAFLACTNKVKLGLAWAGFTSWIAKEGLFKLHVTGDGKLWYGAYGALIEKEIDGEYIVDTSHLVAYQPGIKLKLQLAGGIFSSMFGGEGLVTRVVGKGKITIQSRSLDGLSSWLNPKF
ncbi:TIGR00266 family protein [Pelagibaculum spongiae]|uniref:TIGR00266 family protein n=1 Tax=Pelagibaculum spongiae TaxID=2080658 RepID=A0A2V1GWN7_9GAMM|nr:TIGR00266 family protein [Pelagibaculum spongiae]PVZ69468.1 TIGR00266 family protein [Pelagibaculum spongiae]